MQSIGTPAIPLGDVRFLGSGLNRPECVLAHASGTFIVPDWTGAGGVAVVAPDGTVGRVLAHKAGFDLKPNGIALEPGGAVLIAHLGAEAGGAYRLLPDGAVEPVLTKIGGRALPPCNFPYRDQEGRLWLTVSTRRMPRALGYRPDVDDGFIVLLDRDGARIVADGLGYTNEAHVGPDGETLYVNETFGRRLTTFKIRSDGSLTERRTLTTFGAGTFPDGIAFDAEGGVWVTSIVSNRVIRVAPDGDQLLLLEDCDIQHLEAVETVFLAGTMGRPHLDAIASRRLRSISSLAFAGPDLKTAILGCLLGDALAQFRVAVPGLAQAHWNFDIAELVAAALVGNGA